MGAGETQGSPKRARTNQDSEETIQQEEAKEDQMIQPEQLPVPQSPTQAEWIEHQVTHIPYKAWCPICVKNAAMNNPHKTVYHSRNVAMFCMDYMFMNEKPNEEDRMYPILVVKERITNGIWALLVIRKGVYKSNIVKRVVEIINSIGSPKIIIKSDQEPAIVDSQKDVRKELWDE